VWLETLDKVEEEEDARVYHTPRCGTVGRYSSLTSPVLGTLIRRNPSL
jgi:hypothetical protein